MKPAAFKYLTADSVASAVALKAQHADEGRFLAGGQSLIPAMNFRLAKPNALIDLNTISGLDYVDARGNGTLVIGALTRLNDLLRNPLVRAIQPLIYETAPNVAHTQIRNRATLCGNLANADPASEFPAVMVALNARMRATSVRGDRWVSSSDFFRDIYTTSLEADELLSEIEVPPLPVRTGTCFIEVARRRGDYAMMGVAAVVGLDDDGGCNRCSLVYCNAGTTPRHAIEASKSLIGNRIDASRIAVTTQLAPTELDPPGTIHATRRYQLHLAAVLTERALHTAVKRARAAVLSGDHTPFGADDARLA